MNRKRFGFLAVWRLELLKFSRLIRVQAVLTAAVLVPFLVAGALSVQESVPADTLFGQWLHESGFALPMVILGFAGQWVLPLITSVVSGDVFSSEDHFGTWKTVLTRSRSRGDLFTGKLLAAVSYTVLALLLLAGSSFLAGLLLGAEPIVGLTGQLVAAHQAAGLVMVSWAVQLPPLLGFCALAVCLSVLTRSSQVGVGAPVLIGLLMQLVTLIDLPAAVRVSLLSTGFQAWHGLWAQQPYRGPIWSGLAVGVIWFVCCIALSWIVFRRRSVRVS